MAPPPEIGGRPGGGRVKRARLLLRCNAIYRLQLPALRTHDFRHMWSVRAVGTVRRMKTSITAFLAVLALSHAAAAQSESPPPRHTRANRVVKEVLMGQLALPTTFALGAVGGVLPAGLFATAYSLSPSCTGYCPPQTVLLGSFAAGVLSANAMTALAVTMTGNSLGGHGRYGWSLLGAGMGTSLGGAFIAGAFGLTSAAYAPRRAPDNPSRVLPNDGKTVSDVTAVIAVIAVTTLPVLGATLGYELSSRDSSGPAASPSPVRVVPTASITPASATLGVAGVF
jgi:hypothetical protein